VASLAARIQVRARHVKELQGRYDGVIDVVDVFYYFQEAHGTLLHGQILEKRSGKGIVSHGTTTLDHATP
jgi:hypothetical protein